MMRRIDRMGGMDMELADMEWDEWCGAVTRLDIVDFIWTDEREEEAPRKRDE
jgi:hypothetical protein